MLNKEKEIGFHGCGALFLYVLEHKSREINIKRLRE